MLHENILGGKKEDSISDGNFSKLYSSFSVKLYQTLAIPSVLVL